MRALFILFCIAPLCAQVQVRQILSPANTPLSAPRDIEAGLSGLLYVADTGHDRLIVLDTNGVILYENSEGASAGGLRRPVDIAIGPGGGVLVADAGNRRIMEYTRLLEWKGEFTIVGSDGRAAEPRELCQTTGGDMLVFEADEGQFLRYDSFFSLSGTLGQKSGVDFSPAVASLCFSARYGALWIDEQSGEVFRADPLLTGVSKLHLTPDSLRVNQLAVADSFVLASDDHTLWRIGPSSRDSLDISLLGIEGSKPRDLLLAAREPDRVFLMDRRNGALYNLYWP